MDPIGKKPASHGLQRRPASDSPRKNDTSPVDETESGTRDKDLREGTSARAQTSPNPSLPPSGRLVAEGLVSPTKLATTVWESYEPSNLDPSELSQLARTQVFTQETVTQDLAGVVLDRPVAPSVFDELKNMYRATDVPILRGTRSQNEVSAPAWQTEEELAPLLGLRPERRGQANLFGFFEKLKPASGLKSKKRYEASRETPTDLREKQAVREALRNIENERLPSTSFEVDTIVTIPRDLASELKYSGTGLTSGIRVSVKTDLNLFKNVSSDARTRWMRALASQPLTMRWQSVSESVAKNWYRYLTSKSIVNADIGFLFHCADRQDGRALGMGLALANPGALESMFKIAGEAQFVTAKTSLEAFEGIMSELVASNDPKGHLLDIAGSLMHAYLRSVQIGDASDLGSLLGALIEKMKRKNLNFEWNGAVSGIIIAGCIKYAQQVRLDDITSRDRIKTVCKAAFTLFGLGGAFGGGLIGDYLEMLSHAAIDHWYTVRDFESIVTKAQGQFEITWLTKRRGPTGDENAENSALAAMMSEIQKSTQFMWMEAAVKCNGIR